MDVTENTLELIRKAQRQANDDIAKTISTGTGVVGYDLQAPAKNLYPFLTPIRNRLPRVPGSTGTGTNWRQVSAIIGSGFNSSPWVPEGQRAGRMSYTTATKSANYVTIGEEDAATMEAINAARGFENLQGTMAFRLLQKMMLKEEDALLGGNTSLALGAPASAPTLSASGSGATLPGATYYVKVVPLSLEGYLNSSLANGVATSMTVQGADGQTFTINGGSGDISAEGSQAVSLGQTLFCSTPPIAGTVAYAWYVGTAPDGETLQAITTINSAAFSAPLANGRQSQTAITGDCSTNATAFDGLLTTAFKPGSNAYVATQPTGTAGAGTPLTSSGRGSVVEIDTMFQTMWDTYQLSPTVLYVNAQELQNITNKVLSTGSAPLLRYDTPADGGETRVTASGVISDYFNPFSVDGGIKVPIKIHPRVPPGTIVGWCENLPMQYQSNEVPNVAEVHTRQDYYEIDWPMITRQRPMGVYAEEVLAVYAPFAMGVITNIGKG